MALTDLVDESSEKPTKKGRASQPKAAPQPKGEKKGAKPAPASNPKVIQMPTPASVTAPASVAVATEGGPARKLEAEPVETVADDKATQILNLSRAWNDAKRQESEGKKDVEKFKKDLLALGVKIGFENAFLNVNPKGDPDYTDPRLVKVLKDKGYYDKCLKEPALDPEKVKSQAMLDADVEAALKLATDAKPTFYQGKGE